MSLSIVETTVRRVLFVICPLFSIACWSAPEWPARIAMMDGDLKEKLYEPAVKWQQTVEKVSSTLFNKENSDISIANNESSEINDKVIEKLPELTSTIPVQMAAVSNANNTNIVSSKMLTPEPEKSPIVVKEEPQAIKVNKILTVGDSLMSEIASGLRYRLDKSIKVKDIHKSSTGLTNSEYYDWPSVASSAARDYKPDLIIIHMGGNDGQDMKLGNKWVHIDDPLWSDTYYKRATNMINKIKQASPNSYIVWLGLPAMRDAKFARKQDIIRDVQRKAAIDSGVEYIDGKKGLGQTYEKQGMFEGKRVVLRRTDGIHYSREGGEVLAHLITTDEKLGLNWN